MFKTLGDLKNEMYKKGRITSTNAITSSTEVTQAINNALIKVYHSFPWPFRRDIITLQTRAPYTTGTITTTLASRSITGSSTSWTTGDIGMWLRVSTESELYKVKSVDSTTGITLENPYRGSNTGAGQSYTLYKRLYTLPSSVDDILDDVYLPARNVVIEFMSQPVFDREFAPVREGSPYYYTRWAFTQASRSYSTGTVSGTSGSRTVTGSSTVWLGNVEAGDEFTVGSNRYTIASVDSDTQITLWQALQTSPSASAYSSVSRYAINLQFGPIADTTYNIDIPVLMRGYNLVDDTDLLYVPTAFCECVRLYALAELEYMHDSGKAQITEARADKEYQTLLTTFSLRGESHPTIRRS